MHKNIGTPEGKIQWHMQKIAAFQSWLHDSMECTGIYKKLPSLIMLHAIKEQLVVTRISIESSGFQLILFLMYFFIYFFCLIEGLCKDEG